MEDGNVELSFIQAVIVVECIALALPILEVTDEDKCKIVTDLLDVNVLCSNILDELRSKSETLDKLIHNSIDDISREEYEELNFRLDNILFNSPNLVFEFANLITE